MHTLKKQFSQNYLKSNMLDRILTDDYEINKNLNVQLA